MSSQTRDVVIELRDVSLEGSLTLTEAATMIIVFAHGSGSSRFSTRNRYVAGVLNRAGLATLLFDLLTAEESRVDEVTSEFRFDIPLLGRRLVATLDWLAAQEQLAALAIGLFGASTGAAAALIAAAERPRAVTAVVSRGGRPDLAPDQLARIEAPTLLIVGGLDGPVIEMNEDAAAQLACAHRIEIVPGATHLFSESGALERVAELARDWFLDKQR